MKKIVLRVDSSAQIGSGHFMRCLTLAKALSAYAEVFFICRALSGSIYSLARAGGFKVYELTGQENGHRSGYERLLGVSAAFDAKETVAALSDMTGTDCLIVDHYALGRAWEAAMRPYAKKIMVIDDLADRGHDCDILLDQNRAGPERYQNLTPEGCRLFLGPRYLLLREEFYAAREKLRTRDGAINNILVFFGGGDAGGETMKALRAIKSLKQKHIKVNVVVGASNADKDNIQMFCRREGMFFHCQADYMPKLMNDADIAVGAGGVTSWERRFLGLPALVISIADNQTGGCTDAGNEGWIDYLGDARAVRQDAIALALKGYLSAPEKLKNMGDICLKTSRFGREGQQELLDVILR